ncbi:MAG: 50S ribosomal protein L11 methyltransferase [Salinibacter sp.]
MDTVEVTLSVPILEHDRFIGWLDDRATGFRQTDAKLTAYVPADDWSEALRERLEARLRADGYLDALTLRLVADRNWNAAWEASVTPVRVGPFLLCRSTLDVPAEHDDATVLRIDPERSFGSGHHASTRLTLRLLIDAVAPDDTVVDVGIGTGVLAIAACHLGAHRVLGVDTEPAAVANARANVEHNGVADRVTVREGSVDALSPDVEADVLAANITLDTILDLLPALRTRLAADGDLLLAGLLTSQRGRMLEGLAVHDLTAAQEASEDGWWAVRGRPA